jgi:DNA-binding NarL/FixJ family response regulator
VTKVFLVDDHTVLREGLARTLTSLGFDVVGEAGDGLAALEAVGPLEPDVVLADVSMPSMDGVELTRRMTQDHPNIRVVILSMYADNETLKAALGAGAVGYLLKDASIAEITEVLNSVSAGETDTSLAKARLLLRGNHSDDDDECALSKREVEVLQLIAQGASTEAVARKLFISVKTVKNHLAKIYEKLDATDRTQAVVEGLKLGIVRLR